MPLSGSSTELEAATCDAGLTRWILDAFSTTAASTSSTTSDILTAGAANLEKNSELNNYN
jgi:hypothetical protein